MDKFDTLVTIALDLTAALSAGDRYRRLLEALAGVVRYDAATLLRVKGEELTPVAASGLSPDALGRCYRISHYPRFAAICKSHEPVRFAANDPTSDPFDGLLDGDPTATRHVRVSFGCPLYVDGALIGILTLDALDPTAFDGLDLGFLRALSALVAAQMRVADLMEAIEACAERQGMIARNLMEDLHRGNETIGRSLAMRRLRHEIEVVAGSDLTVLIMGETGVGKELVARAVHAASPRKNAPLLSLNCAALPESLAESEVFGHTKGSFTGAMRDRPGKFEMADGGTLFLDEIGELPLSIQPKLLRVVELGEVQRIGSSRSIQVDVRLLAATNRNLEEEVGKGRFRADLFHRLSVYPLIVPPLRERKEDIPLLAGHFLEMMRRRLGVGPVRLNPDALDLLQHYSWPGNVRELENVLSRAILKAGAEVPRGKAVVVTSHDLGPDIGAASLPLQPASSEERHRDAEGRFLRELVEDFERNLILRAVARHDGNWAAAARDLGMHRSNLHTLAARLGLRPG